MIGNESELGTAENYRRFGAREAQGRSPLYAELAAGVADDPEVLAFLADLPREKRQPNLLLAAVRYLAGVQPGYAAFRAVVLDRRAEVAATMLARRTQTNEPARCATLLPVLASLRPPLALLEVGASAGLNLRADRFCVPGPAGSYGDPHSPVVLTDGWRGSTDCWRGSMNTGSRARAASLNLRWENSSTNSENWLLRSKLTR